MKLMVPACFLMVAFFFSVQPRKPEPTKPEPTHLGCTAEVQGALYYCPDGLAYDGHWNLVGPLTPMPGVPLR